MLPSDQKQAVLDLSVSYIQIGHIKSVAAGSKGHSDEKRPKRFKFNKNDKDVNVSVHYEECVSVVCSITLRLSLRRQISVRRDSKALLHCTVFVLYSLQKSRIMDTVFVTLPLTSSDTLNGFHCCPS